MLETKVERINNALVFTVNGKPIAPLAYVTYNPAGGRYGQFGHNDVKLFSVAVYMGDQGINSVSGIRSFRPGFWKAEGEYDFSMVRDDYSRIIEHEPEALIFPRIYFDVPVWWEQLINPDAGHHALKDVAGEAHRKSAITLDYLKT